MFSKLYKYKSTEELLKCLDFGWSFARFPKIN